MSVLRERKRLTQSYTNIQMRKPELGDANFRAVFLRMAFPRPLLLRQYQAHEGIARFAPRIADSVRRNRSARFPARRGIWVRSSAELADRPSRAAAHPCGGEWRKNGDRCWPCRGQWFHRWLDTVHTTQSTCGQLQWYTEAAGKPPIRRIRRTGSRDVAQCGFPPRQPRAKPDPIPSIPREMNERRPSPRNRRSLNEAKAGHRLPLHSDCSP